MCRIVLALAVFAMCASAARGGELTREIDLRTSVEKETHFLVACARPPKVLQPGKSRTGHAFVVWGKDSESAPSYVEAFGLHPRVDGDGVKSLVLGPIPGSVKDEYENPQDVELNRDVTVRIILKVDKADFDAATAVRKAWDKEGTYEGIERDCASFIEAVLAPLGLSFPDRSTSTPGVWLPYHFVQAASGLNDQSKFLYGTWTSKNPPGRWTLEITRKGCVWTERKGDRSLRRDVKVEASTDGFRISRPNDRAVLEFLGAADPDAILALRPEPSFMLLERKDAGKLAARWHGLFWTKTGKKVAIEQPGSTDRTKSVVEFAR